MASQRFRFKSAYLIQSLSLAMACALLATVAGCRHASSPQSKQQIDFNAEVQPILASNCFSCHGPDPSNRKAGLRLDLGEYAFKKRPGHPDAIVPGHPEESELIKRISSTDPHYLMPRNPQGGAKPLKAADIAVLKEWIAEGAHYKPHWAFEKPVRAALPKVKETGWVKTPIDAFVLARLEQKGLHPSPEADKPTLIRRVTLDLTGLLPTPTEVDAFVKDTSPHAYEHVVDRLLASPSYGEQRSRYWMDYARYSDTYGLHYDNNRFLWPYRDYLIQSFNSNKPFDQFVKEQIAGDLLPARNIGQIIASGYIRAGDSSNEGGAIPEELKFNIARERTEAFGATFMGLTVGCAVCHDHKFDPTTQKDFYQLSAFFNNINEEPFNGDEPDWAPMIRIPKTQNLNAYNRVLSERADLLTQLNGLRERQKSLIGQWLASKKNPPLAVSTDKLQLRLRLDEGGGEVLKNDAPHANPASFPIGKSKPQWGETTWLWPDFRMDTGTRIDLGQTGDYEGNQAFSSGGWFMIGTGPNFVAAQNDYGALISKMDATKHFRGWDLAVRRGIVYVELVNEAPKETALKPIPKKHTVKVPGRKPKKPEKVVKAPKDPTPRREIMVSTVTPMTVDGHWDHIFFTYDGSGKASGVRIYIDGSPAATKTVSDTLNGLTIRTQAPMQLGWRYPDANPIRDTRYQDVRLYTRPLTEAEASRLPYEDYLAEFASRPMNQWSLDQLHVASLFYFSKVNATSQSIREQVLKLNAKLDQLSRGGVESMVSQERTTIAYAHILTRGIYTARTARVEADTPHFLPPLPPGEPHNRKALAEWTVSPENPLTARVAVNRMWNELFGEGIVETTEDFGIMGARPSHPKLLDWLAVEFEQSGWNMKHMYKLMVMSATYRQSAKSTPQQVANDPKNILLARGPRFRMDAEMLRDIALQSGGLLVDKIGGPSVKPYQPPNVWESVGIQGSDTTYYKQDHGDALYRRSLYTYWKRMAIQPDMDAFDAPPRDTACTRRQRTDTPLQALVTMNDTQWIEASRGLAERLIEQGGRQPAQRIQYLTEVLLSRDPSPQMESVLQKSFEQMDRHYKADPKAALALISIGEKPRDTAIPAPELAAWTMVANEALNLDATLNK